MSIHEVIRYVAPIGLAVAGLYLWGFICFLVFRFFRFETDVRLQQFLHRHYEFFSSARRRNSTLASAVTADDIKRSGARGWCMIGLPLISLGFGVDYKALMLSNAVLFFGGLMFAYSWYGLRCLRLLGLATYSKQAA